MDDGRWMMGDCKFTCIAIENTDLPPRFLLLRFFLIFITSTLPGILDKYHIPHLNDSRSLFIAEIQINLWIVAYLSILCSTFKHNIKKEKSDKYYLTSMTTRKPILIPRLSGEVLYRHAERQ